MSPARHGTWVPSESQPIVLSVVLVRSETKTRVSTGVPVVSPWSVLVAFPVEITATRPSGAIAMSTASTKPASAGPLCVVPSAATVVMAGCTMASHGSVPL